MALSRHPAASENKILLDQYPGNPWRDLLHSKAGSLYLGKVNGNSDDTNFAVVTKCTFVLFFFNVCECVRHVCGCLCQGIRYVSSRDLTEVVRLA